MVLDISAFDIWFFSESCEDLTSTLYESINL